MVKLFSVQPSSEGLKLFQSGIQCGFPSPADDYLEGILSLDEICIENKETTFLGRAIGDSLQDVGIRENDIMVIDKSITPRNGDLIIAVINGEFNAKFLKKEKGQISLISANKKFSPIIINGLTELKIWGVVIHIIQSVRGRWPL